MSDFLRAAGAIASSLYRTEGAEAALIVNDDMRIVTWPASAEKLTRFSAAEVTGRAPALLWAGDGEGGRQVHRLFEIARLEGRSCSTCPLAFKGGGSFWGEVRIAALRDDADDEPRGYLLVLRNLHAFDEFVPQLKRICALEEALDDAAGVARGLNNLLTGLVSEFVTGPPGSPAGMDFVAISRLAGRIAYLMRHLTQILRGPRNHPKLLNINDVVSQVVRILEGALGCGIETIVNLDPDLVGVRADALEMEQVFLNLVVNAQRATPNGGVVFVETSNVHVAEPVARRGQTLRSGGYVRVAVRDAGPGMNGEVLAHLLDGLPSESSGPGAELDLLNALRIVNRSGGTILVESQENWGTLVDVYLPIVKLAPKRAEHN